MEKNLVNNVLTFLEIKVRGSLRTVESETEALTTILWERERDSERVGGGRGREINESSQTGG